MATPENYWYLLTLNSSSLAVTGVVTVNGSVKEFVTEAAALSYVQENYGESEVILVRKQELDFSVTSPTTSP